nr:olfactory receptor 7 [Tropidothorax elegans]QQP19781.1 olfactory receptor 86 [Tropidothorax elegans]
MEEIHRQVLRLACYLTGDEEVQQFTLHKAILQFLGYDWWDKPGWGVQKVCKRLLNPVLYMSLLLVVTVLTGHRCFTLDKNDPLGFLLFMNNIIVIFTFSCAMIKTIYMKFFYGKQAKELMDMLVRLGDMKQGRPIWEGSLKACTFFLCLLVNVCFLWAVYCLAKYRVFSYQTSYPWSQDTVHGWLAAFQLSFMTAFYTSQIHSAMDSFFSVSCGIMMAHLQVLTDMLRTIGLPGNRDRATLISAVKLHVNIIRAAEKMNDCGKLLFAFQSLYTVLHACVLIFAFIKADDVLAALSNIMPMLIASYVQLFLYCYYSQKLSNKFEDLHFACYDNLWYRSSQEVQKGLLMFVMASKKQIFLRGLGMAKASFASYLSSIQESISYYLILKTLTAGENNKANN